MKTKQICFHAIFAFAITILTGSLAIAQPADGVSAEVVDVNAKDTSVLLEKDVPYLKEPLIYKSPKNLNDGIEVSSLKAAGADEKQIDALMEEIASGKYQNIDSVLISQNGNLLFESYFRKGRENVPHYQMSITKSSTALALGRAIQLGYFKDVNTPVIDYLKDVDRSKMAKGTDKITVANCLNMKSGIRIPLEKVNSEVRGKPLKGQVQAETIFKLTAPVSEETKEYKYQGTDPSLVMQVIESVVEGSAEDFIQKEVLGKLGITNYRWQEDVSGFPKAAAGSSLRSRDMLKLGMVITNEGKWQGEQLFPKDFIKTAVSPLHTNPVNHNYGYFWWGSKMKVHGEEHHCISARGAGGQFIFILPTLDNTIVVVTSHNKKGGAMRHPFDFTIKKILPAIVKK